MTRSSCGVACVPSLTVEEQSIAEGRVLVAINGSGQTVGTVRIGRDGDDAELALMFVDPVGIGGGTRTKLFEAAVLRWRESGDTGA